MLAPVNGAASVLDKGNKKDVTTAFRVINFNERKFE